TPPPLALHDALPILRTGPAHIRTRGGCSYGARRWQVHLSEHRPRCEPVRHTFAPGAGAPTIRGGGRCVCRSTAPGANRAGTHSHPARVLLRYEVVAGSCVGAPPPVRTGQAHIRTRGGCSYDTRRWQVCCRSTAPGANGAGTHSHPGRVLLRYEAVAGSFVGAPPPVRTGQAHIRTRRGCSYK